jgi:hypothetical protein
MKHLRDIEVRLGWPTGGGREGNWADLVITDRVSGNVILDFELSGEQVAGLLANRGARVSAELCGPAQYERMGMKLEVGSVETEFTNASVREPHAAMNVAALEQLKENGGEWDEASWYRHNYGWGLHTRRWIEDDGVDKYPML